jgi:hypothetical protein
VKIPYKAFVKLIKKSLILLFLGMDPPIPHNKTVTIKSFFNFKDFFSSDPKSRGI